MKYFLEIFFGASTPQIEHILKKSPKNYNDRELKYKWIKSEYDNLHYTTRFKHPFTP